MGVYADDLGLDPERLERRISFLIDRAVAHDEFTTDLHVACAATLRRDAGAIALLLGRIGEARTLFLAAGQQWADLGVFAGYFLMSLARLSSGVPWFESEKGLADVERLLLSDQPAEKAQIEGDRRQFNAMSINSPRQLLNLFQAASGERHRSERASRLASLAAGRLSPNAALQVGTTGVPLAVYLRLYDALARGNLSRRDRDSLLALAIRREELILAAQNDRHHWRLLHKPFELIDFDLLALGNSAIEAGHDTEVALFDAIGERGLAARLPFELARDLEASSSSG